MKDHRKCKCVNRIECKFSLHPLLNLNKSVPPRTNLLEKGLSPNSITSQRYYGLQRLWQSFFIDLDRSRFFLESFTNENAYKEAAQMSSRLLVICSLPTHPFNLLLSFGQKACITVLHCLMEIDWAMTSKLFMFQIISVASVFFILTSIFSFCLKTHPNCRVPVIRNVTVADR